MNLFKSIKSLVVQTYTLVCLSTSAVPTPATPAPVEAVAPAPVATPIEVPAVSTVSGAIVHVPAGALVLYTAPIVSVTTVSILSSESSALLSEWDEDAWLASEVGQQVERMAEWEFRNTEYWEGIEKLHPQRELERAIQKAMEVPTFPTWDEWSELTLTEKASTPLPKVVGAASYLALSAAIIAVVMVSPWATPASALGALLSSGASLFFTTVRLGVILTHRLCE